MKNIIEIIIKEWTRDDYLLFPGCAYNGNRFKQVNRNYPPMYLKDEMKIDNENLITDVPRLSSDNKSRIEITTGDLSTPAACFFLKDKKKGIIISTVQGNGSVNYGFSFEESNSGGIFTISYPARREYIYKSMHMLPNHETAAYIEDDHKIEYSYIEFECDDISQLIGKFFYIRNDLTTDLNVPNVCSFSHGFDLIENKYNLLNYKTQTGVYTVGISDNSFKQRFNYWQPGWIGGGIATFPLLLLGGNETKRRSITSLDYLFKYQSDFGLFYGVVSEDRIYSDGFEYPYTENFNLIRRNGDVLYFLIKQFILLKSQGEKIKDYWENGAKRCADALLDIYKRYNEWGQFVNVETGEILVGNTTSGAIIPASLALCYQYFGNKKYIKVAQEGAEKYVKRDVENGYTTGGPGEVLGCPDSESCFGLLESLVVLYEVTKNHKWLDYAEKVAHLCSTWCVNYNYKFPKTSEFEKLDIKTTGSVIANVQNKHSAPGICTLSGNSLFKLFRYTKDTNYLGLMSEIARFIVQCVSTEDRHIHCVDGTILSEGCINERVNMSDWEGYKYIGGIFNGSCWCEVSHLLTYMEIPGVYVVPQLNILQVTDHVDASFVSGGILIKNPFGYHIRVRCIIENIVEVDSILGPCYENKFETIHIPPFEEKIVLFSNITYKKIHNN